MGNNRKVDIFVEPDASNPGKYLFSMDEGNGKTNELTFNKTKDGMKRWEEYKVQFKLNNKNGANLKFSRDRSKVLWAAPTTDPNPPCPTSQQMDGIFYVASPNDIKDQQLTVTNTDPSHQRFVFGFNFLPAGEQDGPNANYVLYDPIGNNQNGGFGFMANSLAASSTFMAGGAVAGALATFLLNPEATTMTYLWGAVIGAVAGYVTALFLGKRSRESMQGAPHR